MMETISTERAQAVLAALPPDDRPDGYPRQTMVQVAWLRSILSELIALRSPVAEPVAWRVWNNTDPNADWEYRDESPDYAIARPKHFRVEPLYASPQPLSQPVGVKPDVIWNILRVAYNEAQYQPGDHPVVPVRLARFMEQVGQLLVSPQVTSLSQHTIPGGVDGALHIEAAAKLIYAALATAVDCAPSTGLAPAWVERGNSDMQELARKTARDILTASIASRRT